MQIKIIKEKARFFLQKMEIKEKEHLKENMS